MIQALAISLFTGLLLGFYPYPTDKGLKGTTVVFRDLTPQNRKGRRGFKPHPKHKPVV